MGDVYAVVNQKGGVGKTTTAINVAACAALDGKRVLLVDLDAQGNATSGAGVDRSALTASMFDVMTASDPGESAELLHHIIAPTNVVGLDVAPATIDLAGSDLSLANSIAREMRLARALAEVRVEYDITIIDTGPSLGILTINALAASDWVIVPIQCEYYALEGLSQLLQVIDLVRSQLNPDLRLAGAILTMFDARTRLSFEVAEEVRSNFPGRVYDRLIPRNVRLAEAPSYGQPVVVYDPTCAGAQAYQQVYEEVFADESTRTGARPVGVDIVHEDAESGDTAGGGGPG